MIQRLRNRNTYGLLTCAALCGLMVAPMYAAAQDAGDPAADTALDINEIDVSGNTLLPVIDVQAAIYPFEGPGKHLSDVEQARAALQKAYEDKGYQAVTVVIPQQKIRAGVVSLQVIEMKTGTVTVEGGKYNSAKAITAQLPELATGASPNFKTLDTQLAALNTRSADLQVTPQLKPGAAPDTMDVELSVKDKLPLHYGLELNNAYSQDTHHLRVQGNISYGDLWHRGHSLSAFYLTAPGHTKDSEVYALTYSLPLGDHGLRLAATALHSGSDVSTVGSTTVAKAMPSPSMPMSPCPTGARHRSN
jgi:hemolysin activation/secretion protein